MAHGPVVSINSGLAPHGGDPPGKPSVSLIGQQAETGHDPSVVSTQRLPTALALVRARAGVRVAWNWELLGLASSEGS